jgi:peptidoglycan-N-acetylglucosamine deacetylase
VFCGFIFVLIVLSLLANLNLITNNKIYTKEISDQRIIKKIATQSPKVAITFDDGPNSLITPKILTILEQEQVRATFFVLGSNAEKYPRLLADISNQHHQIGNHGY